MRGRSAPTTQWLEHRPMRSLSMDPTGTPTRSSLRSRDPGYPRQADRARARGGVRSGVSLSVEGAHSIAKLLAVNLATCESFLEDPAGGRCRWRTGRGCLATVGWLAVTRPGCKSHCDVDENTKSDGDEQPRRSHPPETAHPVIPIPHD